MAPDVRVYASDHGPLKVDTTRSPDRFTRTPMTTMSRREFIRQAGMEATVAAALVSRGAPLGASPLGLPIGSQTWPHRAMIKGGNFAGLLATLAGIGVRSIEMCSPYGYAEFA